MCRVLSISRQRRSIMDNFHALSNSEIVSDHSVKCSPQKLCDASDYNALIAHASLTASVLTVH